MEKGSEGGIENMYVGKLRGSCVIVNMLFPFIIFNTQEFLFKSCSFVLSDIAKNICSTMFVPIPRKLTKDETLHNAYDESKSYSMFIRVGIFLATHYNWWTTYIAQSVGSFIFIVGIQFNCFDVPRSILRKQSINHSFRMHHAQSERVVKCFDSVCFITSDSF